MINAEVKVQDSILTITVDLSERHGLSQSGNTVTVASTQGGAKIGQGDMTVNLSVYTKEGLEDLRAAAAKAAGYATWGEYAKATKG